MACTRKVEQPQRKPRLHRTRAPTSAQLTQLASTIAHRVCRHLARKGWLEGEDESVFLSDSAGSDDGMDGLRMGSITYRIATGKHAGRKVATLQTLLGDAGPLEGGAGQVGGFSLHAGVAAEARDRLHRAPERAHRTPGQAVLDLDGARVEQVLRLEAALRQSQRTQRQGASRPLARGSGAAGHRRVRAGPPARWLPAADVHDAR